VPGVQYIAMDLEASCWEAAWVRHRMETIEIGAVRLDDALGVVEEYDSFVRPVVVPRLSSFCRKLTSITQEQVDAADTFPKAFARFLTWMGSGPRRLVTWGAFDLGQLRMDCDRHGMVFPTRLVDDHLNLKTAFGKWKGLKRVAMDDALELLGLSYEGHPHRGLDDARNLARLARATLPHLPAR
jgi:inhibitor of KinA sporulation pathway (predicted exonuclease)